MTLLLATEAAWLAGFIDGEGHIGVSIGGGKNRDHIQPHVSVNNTDRRSVDQVAALANRFGGPLTVGEQFRVNPFHRNIFYVNITGVDRLLRFSHEVAMYSVMKAEQWATLIEFCESRSHAVTGGNTPHELELVALLRSFTRKGEAV